nr:hypothetical transcript [Hymenolepis microstoma]
MLSGLNSFECSFMASTLSQLKKIHLGFMLLWNLLCISSSELSCADICPVIGPKVYGSMDGEVWSCLVPVVGESALSGYAQFQLLAHKNECGCTFLKRYMHIPIKATSHPWRENSSIIVKRQLGDGQATLR